MRGGRSGGRGPMGGGRQSGGGGGGGYRNPCLTMHQPWASLLVHGIKRVEGRSWPSPVTGRLWIHAAGKVPDPATVAAMEDFYREIHAVNGVTSIDFPKHYPVSRLIGCVDVVGCVRSEELVCWEDVPESVRLEGLTDFCWLCENPQKLVVPFEMRGYQGVYNLERRIYEGAVRGLSPVQGPLPVKFPLPDPRNPFSLKPGAIKFDSLKSTVVNTPSVSAAIAGARAAANQYSRKDNNAASTSSEIQTRNKSRENHAVVSSETASLPSVVQDSHSSSRKDHNAAAATSSEIQTRNKSRENSADGSSGSDSLLSVVQDSPSYPTSQDPSPIFQNSPSYSQNQNLPSVVVNSPSYSQNQNPISIVQRVPSYSQNQIPVSIVGSIPIYSQSPNPPSIVHKIPSYPHNQIPVSIVGSIPIYSHGENPPSIVRNIPPYSQNQDTRNNVPSSPFYSHSRNLPSIAQNSPSYSHSHNPPPRVQNSPSYLQNHNASLAVQNSPSILQNQNTEPRRSPRLQNGASNRLVAAALRDLGQSSLRVGRERTVPQSRPE